VLASQSYNGGIIQPEGLFAAKTKRVVNGVWKYHGEARPQICSSVHRAPTIVSNPPRVRVVVVARSKPFRPTVHPTDREQSASVSVWQTAIHRENIHTTWCIVLSMFLFAVVVSSLLSRPILRPSARRPHDPQSLQILSIPAQRPSL
jgi:hypothetical protein